MARKTTLPKQRVTKGGDRKKANLDVYPGIKSQKVSKRGGVTVGTSTKVSRKDFGDPR